MIDLYCVLGVDRDATPDELKCAWRAAARDTHPDLNPDDPVATAQFQEASEAYKVLCDADSRAGYDLALKLSESAACPQCGLPKLPTHRVCVMCSLRDYQMREADRKAQDKEPSTDPWSYGDDFRVPSSDALLHALLSEAALRNLSQRAERLDVHVTVGADGALKVGGATVETIHEIQRNLERGNKLLRSMKRFFGWS